MTEWELTRYLIDAKKCVDSMMYIEQNLSSLKHINVREKINSRLREFYINCCDILDKVYPKKKELCANDETAKRLYYERDKNYAHKDSNYEARKYDELSHMVSDLQKQIRHIRKICEEALPEVVTLDFVPHDQELFRLVNGVTAEKEDSIEQAKYPLKDKLSSSEGGQSFKVFGDTEDLKDISDSDINDFATLVEGGINNYEGLQNRQDFCIRTNVLFGLDMWCTLNQDTLQGFHKLEEIGVINKYGVIQLEMLANPEVQKQIDAIIQA